MREAVRRLFGDAAPEPVLASPGFVRAGDAEGQALPNWDVLWDDDPDAERRAARWSAESAKRFLAAQIAVGTVDQALLAGLCVKHAHLRGACLARSLIVVDEVHASDAYMTETLRRLLNAHADLGGYALLMSATLGSTARTAWLPATKPCDVSDAVATPYPAVWTERSPHPRAADAAADREKAVQMRLEPTMAAETAARLAVDAAAAGARVLVIRNTVDVAIETAQAVEAMDADAQMLAVNGVKTLHHSRFAPEDRALLDRAVEAALSPKRRGAGSAIVVGTQTVEQSLDIDADLLITDLCPVDVLLQRIGRLHRHALARPDGFAVPLCIVMSPTDGLAPLLAPKFENGLGAWLSGGTHQGVYLDLPAIELTRRLVVDEPFWRIPSMNRALVEGATHPDVIRALLDELGSCWRDDHDTVLGKEFAARNAAGLVALDRTKPFDDQANRLPPSGEEAIRTRLGDETGRLVLAEPAPGPFGVEITAVPVPRAPMGAVDFTAPPEVDVASGELLIRSGDVELVYDRHGVRAQSD